MSKELFEAMMKEINKQATDLGYSQGAAARDFLSTIFRTLQTHFWQQTQDGDERGPKNEDDFEKYARNQIYDIIKDLSKE